MYFDGDGRLVVVLADPSFAPEARAALSVEPLVQRRSAGSFGHEFDVAAARIEQGDFHYATLEGWYRELIRELRITPAISGISVTRNRIRIGVASVDHESEVQRAVVESAIPADVVETFFTEPARLSDHQTLRNVFRPVPAGVQIGFYQNPPCTIGPNVRWHGDPSDPQDTFLMNSHCTNDPFTFDPSNHTVVGQSSTDAWLLLIGMEQLDPEPFPCAINPSHGCRNSDAALGLYHPDPESEFGKIARTSARNATGGWLWIDHDDPRFEIVDRMEGSFIGETVEKVGRTSGWTGGSVEHECADIAPLDPATHAPTGPTRLCSILTRASSDGGDSGAPVFRVISGEPNTGLDVELRGMVWGRMPCPTASGVSCFIASDIGGIEQDLDPNWQTGLFQYWPGGPIW